MDLYEFWVLTQHAVTARDDGLWRLTLNDIASAKRFCNIVKGTGYQSTVSRCILTTTGETIPCNGPPQRFSGKAMAMLVPRY